MTRASLRGFTVNGGVTVGVETAEARTRRVMSDAGSETDPSRTGSADAASKTLAAATPADGRAAGSADRHEASTCTSRGNVSGITAVTTWRGAPGGGAPGGGAPGGGAPGGGAPVRQSQPIAAMA
jgi:hypothetical protein